MKRIALIVVLIAGGIAALHFKGLLPFGSTAAPTTRSVAAADVRTSVTVIRAASAELEEQTLVTGTLVARGEILVAPEVEGLRVLELLVEEGETVARGQILARLEQETLKVQLAQNDASLARATAAIAQAGSNIAQAEARSEEAASALDRARPLRQSGVVSESTFDTREMTARTAAAALAAARDGLKLAEAEKAQIEAQRRDVSWRLSKTEIRAPTDGIVSRRNARIGGMASGVSVAEPMFRIIDRGEVELEAELPEADLGRLRPGLAARVTLAGGTQVTGSVRLVAPEVDKATRQGKVRISLGTGPDLRIGSFGRGTVTTATSRGLVVPASAVLFGSGGAFVQVVRNDQVSTRKVDTGLRSGDLVEIRGGLEAGELIVARSGTFLRDGDQVRPIVTGGSAQGGVN